MFYPPVLSFIHSLSNKLLQDFPKISYGSIHVMDSTLKRLLTLRL